MNFNFHKNRVGIVALVLLLVISIHGFAQNSNSENSESIFRDFKTELMWKANVKIGTMINVGESKRGTRRVIPITGGTFSGPKINGEVLPGGEDWQLVRPDGDTELYARYLMKTDDGTVLQILNKALMHAPAQGEEGGFYVKSVIDIEAPIESSYDYLNHAIFLGTLEMPQLKPNEEPYVIIGVYKVL
ncbi:DUF3237 family protein [Draconibacterium orientale]|uniref:DUF3237 family protein n=1 Tax=Draconibacterium orientale TaxID=1168034 RepID=UPI002ABDE61D|nr:DUF3237 family protein [Draconibacterium orientale]